jgi:hypothetical protein
MEKERKRSIIPLIKLTITDDSFKIDLKKESENISLERYYFYLYN